MKIPEIKIQGVGHDGTDGIIRITKGDNYLLQGGSKETHTMMQDVTVKVNEKLDRVSRRRAIEPRDVQDAIQDSLAE